MIQTRVARLNSATAASHTGRIVAQYSLLSHDGGTNSGCMPLCPHWGHGADVNCEKDCVTFSGKITGVPHCLQTPQFAEP